MKKIRYLLPVLGLLFALSACDDNDNSTIYVDPRYANTDAEEAIALSLSYSSYGLVANMNQISNEIEDVSSCDSLYSNSDSFHGETYPGTISYDYEYNEEYNLSCDDNPEITYALTGTQTFKTLRSTYQHELKANFVVSGLRDSSDDEIYTGEYQRSGIWEAEHYDDNYQFDFDCKIDKAFVSKQSNKIYAGTATFTLQESYSFSNLDFTYKGTVEFISENEARVEFDNGDVFNVDLNNVSIGE